MFWSRRPLGLLPIDRAEVTSTREPTVILRQGPEGVAIVAAAELRGLLETAHRLRSPRNARRLLTALIRAQDPGMVGETVEDFRREPDLGEAPRLE